MDDLSAIVHFGLVHKLSCNCEGAIALLCFYDGGFHLKPSGTQEISSLHYFCESLFRCCKTVFRITQFALCFQLF